MAMAASIKFAKCYTITITPAPCRLPHIRKAGKCIRMPPLEAIQQLGLPRTTWAAQIEKILREVANFSYQFSNLANLEWPSSWFEFESLQIIRVWTLVLGHCASSRKPICHPWYSPVVKTQISQNTIINRRTDRKRSKAGLQLQFLLDLLNEVFVGDSWDIVGSIAVRPYHHQHQQNLSYQNSCMCINCVHNWGQNKTPMVAIITPDGCPGASFGGDTVQLLRTMTS